MAHARGQFNAARGFTLIEAVFAMAILAGAFVAVLSILNYVGNGVSVEMAYSDQTSRTSGTLYDIISELRDAAAYSPNFYVEVDPAKPPKIVFDKVESVDATGNVIWGSTITYRLERCVDSNGIQFQAEHPDVIPGRVIREELFNDKIRAPIASAIEERVPYQFIQNGAPAWGFNVTRNGSALAVSISRFGNAPIDSAVDMPLNVTTQSAPMAKPAQLAQPNSPLTSQLQNGVVISTATGTYFLRNPKLVIPAE